MNRGKSIGSSFAALSLISLSAVVFGAVFAANLRAQSRSKIDEARVSRALSRVRPIIDVSLKKAGVPGFSMAIVYKDKVISVEGYGVRKIGEAARVDGDTVFQLASLSKPVTATVLGALVSKERLKWDDLVRELDPAFRANDPFITQRITLRDFLSHRSGLPDHAGDFLEDLGYNRKEVLARLRFLPTASGFRNDYAYTNFGFTQAAEAVAVSRGEAWENVAASVLYRPLGMTSTSSRHSDYLAAANRAWLHVPVNGSMIPKYDRNPDAQSPAGGVCSSVNDLAKWLRMLLNKGMFEGVEIVNNSALAEAQSPQMRISFNANSGKSQFYGLGWNVSYDERGQRRISHSGAFSRGAGTNITFYPEEQIGFIGLSNAAPVGLPEAIAQSFFEVLFRELPESAPLSQDWLALFSKLFAAMEDTSVTDYAKLPQPSAGSPSHPLEAYTGTFRSSYFGDLRISRVGNQLYMQLGSQMSPPPARHKYPLTHWEKSIFTYAFDEESDSGVRGVLFTDLRQGHLNTITIDNFRKEAGGRFERIASSPPAKRSR